MNYPEAISWLYGRQQLGIQPGLENIRRLLDDLGFIGNSQRFIHVAGTNGKGSVCAIIDSICRAAGLRTGLYTSPHLVSFRERIRINGEMISREDVAAGLTKIKGIIEDREYSPTFFEVTTALAFDYFQREEAGVVALETGLGGRLDATNVITPAVSVITAIDIDHTGLLGSTLEQIAAEKAGIIKPGVPVISVPQQAPATEILVKIAAEKHAQLEFVTGPENLPVGLAGSHQKMNAAVALSALRTGGIKVPAESIRNGLRDVSWPGRFQIIDSHKSKIKNPVILDGAHNEAAAGRLVLTWREMFGDEKCQVVLGILKDKDMTSICRALIPLAAAFVITPVQSPRTAQPEELQALIRKLDPAAGCAIARDFVHAIGIAATRSEKILVTGSLFLVGEALAHFNEPGRKPHLSLQ